MTLNVPGETCCGKLIGEEDRRGWVFRDGKRIELSDLNLQEIREIFFSCEDCCKEKFWQWPYHCPRCDSDMYAVLEVGEAKYDYGAAMEYGGNPLGWDETWKCRVCGYVYVIGNANY